MTAPPRWSRRSRKAISDGLRSGGTATFRARSRNPRKRRASRDKALLRFITCGSVDDGKSTLIGRMLYDSSMIADDQLEALDRDSKKFGTQGGALDFALLVDGLAAEREQGITIDVAYRYFKTDRRSFIVADTPGHEQYTRNMATGASTADLAIILIDARKGILPQTRRHSFIVSMLGVRDVALAINKMDLVDYSEARFNEIVAAYREMARDLNFRSIAPLPISALAGDNIASLSERTPWFQGEPLLTFLENVETAGAELSEAAFRFPVQWVNRPNLDFRGFSGWVASGAVKVGDEIASLPVGAHEPRPAHRDPGRRSRRRHRRPVGHADARRRDRRLARRRARRRQRAARSRLRGPRAAAVDGGNRHASGRILYRQARRAHRQRQYRQGASPRRHPHLRGGAGAAARPQRNRPRDPAFRPADDHRRLPRQPRSRRLHPDRPHHQRDGGLRPDRPQSRVPRHRGGDGRRRARSSGGERRVRAGR